jgi:transposase
MDNTIFHYSDKVEDIYKNTGVRWEFLALYPLTINLIEEFFGELKTYAKSYYKEQSSLIRRDFEAYVKACIKAVGNRQRSAKVISVMLDIALTS